MFIQLYQLVHVGTYYRYYSCSRYHDSSRGLSRRLRLRCVYRLPSEIPMTVLSHMYTQSDKIRLGAAMRAQDQVPSRGGGVTLTRILSYEGCPYGRSSVKDTTSHSCGTLWYPCGTIHGVPCSRTSLSGVSLRARSKTLARTVTMINVEL